jgi:predicted phage tail protein
MLTDDMTRLCREIVALRGMRAGAMNALQNEAEERKQAVAGLCSQMRDDREAMASRTKKERITFLKGVRRSVNAQRREMRNDLAGASKAWAGETA